MPLRIVIDVRHIKDFGIGTYIRNLILSLAEIDRENRYCLASSSADVPELQNLPENFEILEYRAPRQRLLRNASYAWFLRGLAPDLVHIPLSYAPPLLRQPYVVTVHDMSSFLFGSSSGVSENIRLYQFRRGLLRAKRVIAVSAATRRDVENLLGIPPDRLRLVYGAPDPRFLNQRNIEGSGWAEAKEQMRVLERYQIQRPFLLYAGRIRPHKNIPRLIEAFAIVRGELESHTQYRDLRLLIIGDEISKHSEVRRAVAQTRMQNAVRFLGFIPFDTLRIFYSAASAFVFPSLYEGFGLPPLEAMASGIPVVTSSVSSLPEVVGDAAIIVTPENPFDIARGIREALLDEKLRLRLIRAGLEQVQNFNWRRTAEQTLRVYLETANPN